MPPVVAGRGRPRLRRLPPHPRRTPPAGGLFGPRVCARVSADNPRRGGPRRDPPMRPPRRGRAETARPALPQPGFLPANRRRNRDQALPPAPPGPRPPHAVHPDRPRILEASARPRRGRRGRPALPRVPRLPRHAPRGGRRARVVVLPRPPEAREGRGRGLPVRRGAGGQPLRVHVIARDGNTAGGSPGVPGVHESAEGGDRGLVPRCSSSGAEAPIRREEAPHKQEWTDSVPAIFMELLEKVRDCLKRMDGEEFKPEWLFFLLVLRELDGISRLHEGGEEKLRAMLMEQRTSMNVLLGRAIRSEEHLWILPFKEVMEGETRRHVVMMMFPEVKEDYEVLHEMLIDRQQLLAESFEYVRQADPEALRSGLFMEFKNEEATGPGVLREWFCLVCRELFNTENALFITCPNDQRRFFPNPGSVVNSLHLDYFRFCGRMIALALMYKVQVGVLFDPLFFVQLGGKVIALEDVRDSDPCFYTSCKQILEMDAALLDSDALGLTFVREINELGSLREVELCREGKGITVTSRNRDRYIELLIRHRFVTSISEQTRLFAEGFADILGEQKHLRCFFRSLELKDLDILLNGSEETISVEDWKGHTEYNGYKETDNQVCWFWKVLESMSADQRRVLLFFWTSVNYLPITGFRGLPSKLYIYKGPESNKRLPSSHTCFFQLGLPAYTSMEIMRERLLVITQEHVSCSFGKW
ncbi:E3 ubiquitin-protein ligase UPL5 [Acorus calamus]|uniref:HECT-type E3 ubiquitin transferase n=1 Tax=Acorus calamus TaxID=4465 RepID=A0AAV9D3W9_ACOCL|nr:E3 ubiquitin-protein ligase UPL5 [Acorus calamus]